MDILSKKLDQVCTHPANRLFYPSRNIRISVLVSYNYRMNIGTLSLQFWSVILVFVLSNFAQQYCLHFPTVTRSRFPLCVSALRWIASSFFTLCSCTWTLLEQMEISRESFRDYTIFTFAKWISGLLGLVFIRFSMASSFRVLYLSWSFNVHGSLGLQVYRWTVSFCSHHHPSQPWPFSSSEGHATLSCLLTPFGHEYLL